MNIKFEIKNIKPPAGTPYDAIKRLCSPSDLNNTFVGVSPYHRIYHRLQTAQKKLKYNLLLNSLINFNIYTSLNTEVGFNFLYNYKQKLNEGDNGGLEFTLKGQNLYSVIRRSNILPGLTFKTAKRLHKFGSQEIIKNNLDYYFGSTFHSIFGKENASIAVAFTASILVGCIEEPTNLPIEIVTNYINYNKIEKINKSLGNVFNAEINKFKLRFKWATFANMTSSGVLFTTQACLKKFVLQNNAVTKNDEQLSLIQKLGISGAAAFNSVLFSYPIHLVKDHIESNINIINGKESIKFIASLLKKQGGRSICQSLFFKTVVLTSTMTIVDEAIENLKKIL